MKTNLEPWKPTMTKQNRYWRGVTTDLWDGWGGRGGDKQKRHTQTDRTFPLYIDTVHFAMDANKWWLTFSWIAQNFNQKMEYSFPMQSGQACSSHNSAWSLFFKSYIRKQIMRRWHCLLQSLSPYHHLQLLSEFLHLPLQGLVFMQFFFVISKD